MGRGTLAENGHPLTRLCGGAATGPSLEFPVHTTRCLSREQAFPGSLTQPGWIQLAMFVSFVKQCHMAGDIANTWGGGLS